MNSPKQTVFLYKAYFLSLTNDQLNQSRERKIYAELFCRLITHEKGLLYILPFTCLVSYRTSVIKYALIYI